MSNMFIPEKIRVGFQNRKDTYTGKLAYVIYYDAKGKLRKEKSWSSWRDDNIDPVEFDNKPQNGFILNKDIQRFNWGHFGSNRSYIRIYDSRGIEFEITPENLIGILTETDCLRRGLEGEFVYAWKGTELVLLPCCSQEYKEAKNFTSLQSKKMSTKDLVPGCSYTTKRKEEVIYMGRFPWYKWNIGNWKRGTNSRTSKKQHIFAHTKSVKKPHFVCKSGASFLAMQNSPDPVHNYPKLLEAWNSDIRSSEFKDWIAKPCKETIKSILSDKKDYWGNKDLKRSYFTKWDNERKTIDFYRIYHVEQRDQPTKYEISKYGILDTQTLEYRYIEKSDRNYWSLNPKMNYANAIDEQELEKRLQDFNEVYLVLENDSKIHVQLANDLHHN